MWKPLQNPWKSRKKWCPTWFDLKKMTPNVCKITWRLFWRSFFWRSKVAQKFFGQVWGNSGKNPSHPQKFACTYTYLAACSLVVHVLMMVAVATETSSEMSFTSVALAVIFTTSGRLFRKEFFASVPVISDGFTHRSNRPEPRAPRNSFIWRLVTNLKFAKLRRGITSQFTLNRAKNTNV